MTTASSRNGKRVGEREGGLQELQFTKEIDFDTQIHRPTVVP